MIETAVFAIAFVLGASAKEAVIIGEPGNGEKIPIGIYLHNGSAVTISGQPDHPQSNFAPSVNFYDFDKKLEARKVVQEDACYIRKLTGTYNQMKQVVDDATSSKSKVTTKVSEQLNIPGKEIHADDLVNTVGPKIAQFCSGYSVFWLNENNVQARKTKRGWWRRVRGNAGVGYSQGGGFSVSAGISF